MNKPDKALRGRPLVEIEDAVGKLKRVVLFHPDEIVQELKPKMCVCRKDERKGGKLSKFMIQCDERWEWFHYDCVELADDFEADGVVWNCEWCTNEASKDGKQRWTSGRTKAKLRHVKDLPKLNGAILGGNAPVRYTAPPTWDGKVDEVKDLSQRMAVKSANYRSLCKRLLMAVLII